MNLYRPGPVERGMRTLLFAALFATASSFSPAPLPISDPDLAITAGSGRDGGKKKKDEEKEEDYAVKLRGEVALIS